MYLMNIDISVKLAGYGKESINKETTEILEYIKENWRVDLNTLNLAFIISETDYIVRITGTAETGD